MLALASHAARARRGPHQLPPGRHGLSRNFVASNQRARILLAVAEATAEKGYAGASVEDITRHAGVSRRTFYEQFANKHDAFVAAYEQVAHLLVSTTWKAAQQEEGFAGRLTAGIRAFLELLVASPAFARMCIVEVLAAGPEAVALRSGVMEEFAKLIDQNARELLDGNVPHALTAETIVGGIYEAIYARIARGETPELLTLLPDLVQTGLLPYVGSAVAAEHARAMRAELSAAS